MKEPERVPGRTASEPCKHLRVYFRDLLTGQPLERRCQDCNELLTPLPTLERQLAEAQARLRKANCDYGDGWLSDDLECQVDVEPWCGKHAVLYYIRANKEAQGKLARIETGMCTCDAGPVYACLVHDPPSVLGRILKET